MPAAPSHRDLDLSARAIARALRADEFDLDFQPIVDLATTRTVGYEALVRWVRPGRGRVTAGAFLPAVEDAGLMAELGRHVLERGLAQLASWGDDEDAHGITVNIAPSDLVRPGFAADVGRIVANARIDPQRLVLEFTEEALRVDAAAVADTLARLRDRAGVQLAIDDFGTLRSSLETLTLPIDVIKLDRGVTTRALASPRHRTVLAHLLDLSRAVGSIVIGEGIEEPAELEVLESLGCEYAQGYLLGRPGPAT